MKKSALLLVLTLVVFLAGCSDSSSSSSKKSYETEAWVCAQMKVESMLRSPSTADFPAVSSKSVATSLGGNKYKVDSYVDAENGFGGTVRTYFSCNVTYNPSSDGCTTVCTFE